METNETPLDPPLNFRDLDNVRIHTYMLLMYIYVCIIIIYIYIYIYIYVADQHTSLR